MISKQEKNNTHKHELFAPGCTIQLEDILARPRDTYEKLVGVESGLYRNLFNILGSSSTIHLVISGSILKSLCPEVHLVTSGCLHICSENRK